MPKNNRYTQLNMRGGNGCTQAENRKKKKHDKKLTLLAYFLKQRNHSDLHSQLNGKHRVSISLRCY